MIILRRTLQFDQDGMPPVSVPHDIMRVRTFGDAVTVNGVEYTRDYTITPFTDTTITVTGDRYQIELYKSLFRKSYVTEYQRFYPDIRYTKSVLTFSWTTISKSEVDTLKSLWDDFTTPLWVAPNEIEAPDVVVLCAWGELFNLSPATHLYNEHWAGDINLREL